MRLQRFGAPGVEQRAQMLAASSTGSQLSGYHQIQCTHDLIPSPVRDGGRPEFSRFEHQIPARLKFQPCQIHLFTMDGQKSFEQMHSTLEVIAWTMS
jgi:hypothetical protein